MTEESWKSRAMPVIPALLALAGVIVVLLCTSRYGVGASPDSAGYLSAARSLLAGQGYRYPDGGIYTQWPPLFPTLLAAIGLAGVDPQVGARWLNALAFGLIVYLSGRLFLRCTTSRPLVVAGTLAVLASSPLLDCSVMAWSEPVFIVLMLLFVLCIPGFLRRQTLPGLALVSILAALACLQRYIGVTLILTGAVLIALNTSRASFLRRVLSLAVFGAVSTIPLALWCLRNRALAGETVGVHRPHVAPVSELVRAFVPAAQIVTTWLSPWAQAGPVRMVGWGLVMALAGTALVLSRRIDTVAQQPADSDGKGAGSLQVRPAVLLALIYFGCLVAFAAALAWRPEPRHMAPIYPFFVALMVAGIEGAYRLLPPVSPGHRRLMGAAGVLLCVLWLQYPLRALSHSTRYHMRDGAGEYTTSGWQESPFVQWLRRHPPEGRVFSNALDAAYVLAGIPAATTPFHPWNTAEFARREFAAQPSYIVWFHGLPRNHLYDLRELRSRYQLEEVASFPRGAVYRYLGPGGPAVSAVYRFWSVQTGRHFYTIRKAERDALIGRHDGVWTYEGPVFYAFAPDGTRPADVLPVYRFWSAGLQAHFYTIDETEKDQLLAHPSGAWTCEGAAFYAWPRAGAKDALPVYRFWSARLGRHFFTIDEAEKAQLLDRFADTWTCEGIVWYAYGPQP